MTDTPETAEWEPEEDTSDTVTSEVTSEKETVPSPVNPPMPGMKWDSDANKWIAVEPRNREQRYRQQLRATEAERDQLRERLERRDKADIERMIAGKMIDPADLWAGGITLADVLDPDTGEISPQLVDEAVGRTVKQHPHWRYSAAAPASQVTSPHGGVTAEEQPTWQQLFQASTRPK